MAITVLFFANVREAVGVTSISVESRATLSTVAELRETLAARGDQWEVLRHTKHLRAAVNQNLVSMDAHIKDGDEVAFFPPVTGG